ncbi:3'-to-5' oligoribonuclease A [Mesoplasma florum W37]|uniref:3'-to-5' oligoribonuclease A n=1 Tax=Mesoplasma florum TaxID=2151 RepID=A0AAD0MQY3_MESFO|nr:bifunctional oligoribonuclease/PAP phosphatase NrnA [Mesoplasma florum]AGY41584.1 3'-to-5' oligoribonuclease A [Mesoplasma florum W37]AVN59795.1 bifunctional oligoribonuclease/PAP phosphatase NrnA [Mesoplasma florum]AVN65216.1 bifunctional oligoribonuclease/PAP phosphatase NrnA [Mesoplasma florum]AVN65922.1 3'-to-5' oligoribonuclease A [Mesoplasma florum]
MTIYKQIKEVIEKYDKIIILRHIVPDGDAYGSQLGLKELIKTNYPNKEVYAFGEEIGYLKHAGTPDVFTDEAIFKDALVIVTDCGNVERIDNQNYDKGAFLLKIDHHPDATPYGDLSWVDVNYTSASEMVGDLAVNNNWEITPVAARVIYHGICTDSGRFLFGGITPRTFEVCARLIETGFDVFEMYKTMYKRSFPVLALQSELIASAKVTDHKVGYIILPDELMKKYNLSYEENGKFSNLLKDLEGIDIWITFSIREDGKWRVEFRSNGIAVNELAVKWGGGGHKMAAGAIINNLDEAMQIVEDANQIIIDNE